MGSQGQIPISKVSVKLANSVDDVSEVSTLKPVLKYKGNTLGSEDYKVQTEISKTGDKAYIILEAMGNSFVGSRRIAVKIRGISPAKASVEGLQKVRIIIHCPLQL